MGGWLTLSCQAETLPPRTSRDSRTMGLNPASQRYLAVDKPARPAPAMTTVGLSFCSRRVGGWSVCSTHPTHPIYPPTLGRGSFLISSERASAVWKDLLVSSRLGLG